MIPSNEELTTLFEKGLLANQMACRFELADPQEAKAVSLLCAELHNTNSIDLLQMVEDGSFQRLPRFQFFSATNFFCGIIPELESSPMRMMTCVETLVIHGGEDLAASQPNAAFREWCAKRPDSAREVIAAATSGEELASRYLTFAIEALKDVAGARQMALAFSGARRLSAITALGRINDTDPASCSETLASFVRLLERCPDDDVRGCMLHATAAIQTRQPEIDQSIIISLVRSLVEGRGKFVLHQAACALWMNWGKIQQDIIHCLLDALNDVDPANNGTMKTLEHGLQLLLRNGQESEAIDFVTKFLSSHQADAISNYFNSFISSVISGPSKLISQVMIKWLLSGSPLLCNKLTEALQGHGIEGPSLDLLGEDLAIPPREQVFLCRKAIGWFFLMPKTVSSILVSVLRVCDAETAAEVEDLLTQVVLLNFNCAREFLKGLGPDDPARPHIDQAISRNDEYLEGLRSIPPIKEFDPSEAQRQTQLTHERDQMRCAEKLAQEQSILSKIVSTSVILYGNRALSFVKDGEGPLRQVEIDLKSYGVTFETPRLEIIDPVGLDFTLRVFRAERLPS